MTGSEFPIWYFGQRHSIVINHAPPAPAVSLRIGNSVFTDTGGELALIAGSSPNEEYRLLKVAKIREAGYTVNEG
jgi:hypothetical protein